MSRFSARVAVYVALIQGDSIFLLKRANTGYRDGEWAMPAGHVESGETPAEAALRELREETGVSADESDVAFAHTLYRLCGPGQTGAYVDYLFVCRNWAGAPFNAEPAKASDAQWFQRDALPEIVDFHAAMLARAKNGAAFSVYRSDD